MPIRVPWNSGKPVGARPPLRLGHDRSMRTNLEIEGKEGNGAIVNQRSATSAPLTIGTTPTSYATACNASKAWIHPKRSGKWDKVASRCATSGPSGRCSIRFVAHELRWMIRVR